MDILNRTKTTLKSKITRLESFVTSVNNEAINETELKVKLRNVTALQKSVEELRNKSYAVPDLKEAEINSLDEELNLLDDRLEVLEVKIETIIDSYTKTNSETVVNKNENKSNESFEIKTKIPPLNLPEFSGKYEEFSAFKIQFDELISNNEQLSENQKLYYLRSCLKHDAKNLASNFDTFVSLYEALQSRYDNKRLIIDIHVQSILNFKKIERENAEDIRAMIDCITKNLRALKVLKYERNDLFDIFLQTILLKKLDFQSRKNYEVEQKTKEVPTFDEFIKFLEQRESVLLSINRNVVNVKSNINKNFPVSKSSSKAFIISENKNKNCVACKKSWHPLFRCETFLKLNIDERLKLIRLHKICELCLKMNHKKNQCYSQYRCMCGFKHNKLVCGATQKSLSDAKQSERDEISLEASNNKQTASVLSNSSRCSQQIKRKNVLFSTAEIYLQCKNNKRIKIRAILDSASNVCVLSKKISDRLGINKQKIKTPVYGLNGLSQNIEYKLNTFISNEDSSFCESVDFLIVNEITELTPSSTLDISNLEIPQILNLADKSFYEAGEIHALISADIFFKVLKQNTYKINDEFFFKESQFGWLACGKLQEKENGKQNQCFFVTFDSLQDTLKSFFDLESLGIRDDPVYHENDMAMEIFNETVQFKNERYVVQLPFRKSYKELADNYPVAKQRFQNLWRRFRYDSDLHHQYLEILHDYIEQGIIEEIKTDTIENELNKPLYYLPHQAVRKEGRLTSTTRIVFDAGSHKINELSLNDCLWPGINLNPNLLDILINFRLNKVALCSDIKQAFLQISLAGEHKDAVRFLWSDDDPCVNIKPKLQVYRFNRVIFGVSSSPFLLAATIRHHIKKYVNEFPDIVQLLDRCFYVDDFISGGNDFEEALHLSRNAKHIMEAAGMYLRKWISNDTNLIEQWEREKFDVYPVEKSVSLGINETKVLGLSWDTREDYLTMDTRSLLEFLSINKNTKRFILQAIGKIFDPLGLITPYTVRVKCLIQDLWSEKVPWDDNLPPRIEKEWKTWCEELSHLQNLKIPRLVLDSTLQEDIVELHSFCDASKKAYGAVIYLKSKTRDGVSVKLVTSKGRVAPLNGITLPRLELLGALVAARLMSKVKKIVNLKRNCVEYFWTDSKIVQFWIKGEKNRWKQFVANRVGEIKNLTDPNSWHHCPGKENPADILSRGLSAEQLIQNDKWWNGPPFLKLDNTNELVFDCPMPNEESYLHELKISDSNVFLTLKNNSSVYNHLINYSNKFLTIIRILSYVFRFIHNVRNKHNKKLGPINPEELNKAETFILRELQSEEFAAEVCALKNKGNISHKSKIFNLSPFLDENNIIRVGGRLQNSNLAYSSKHPILLPAKSKLTEMILNYYHKKHFHVGPQYLLFHVRQKYWPIHGRNLCKKIVHNCIVCFKANPKQCLQKMGNLPKQRITPDKIFNTTGIDLCGPFLIKNKYQRKGPEIKIYVGIFICLVTKAIHIELISDLTSQALIAALKRFISRRGKCHEIFSDNGTNMTGAYRELSYLYKLVRDQDEALFAFFAEENIKWVFIPPRSPNWGGLWEANIKTFKYHFKRVAGNSKFTYEEMLTLVTQIEALLNSRPLIPLSADIEDLEALTPAHFLIGRPITALAEPSLLDIEPNRLNVWQKITKSVQTIWKKWSLSYLNSLQQRGKWIIEKENLKIGDMVLVREENLPPCKWLLGRIIALYPGKDNKVRLVDVKTSKGIYKRSISRLSVLPIEN